MGINLELARMMEKRARELAKANGMPETFWELYLLAAYEEGLDAYKKKSKKAKKPNLANCAGCRGTKKICNKPCQGCQDVKRRKVNARRSVARRR